MSTNLRLLQYKWLSRQYITPVKLHHFHLNIPEVCYKCTKGNSFWVIILNSVSQIIGKVIPLDPRVCILHIYPLYYEITKKDCY